MIALIQPGEAFLLAGCTVLVFTIKPALRLAQFLLRRVFRPRWERTGEHEHTMNALGEVTK